MGCSSKQYYNPDRVYSGSSSISSTKYVVDFNRDGATLEDGTTLTKEGKLKLNLKDGYRFINQTKSGIVIANGDGVCKILKDNKSKSVKFSKSLLAGNIIDNKLIYLLKDNSFGVYDLSKESIIFNDKGEKTHSIDKRVTNPLKVDKFIVIPLLNGKIVVLNPKNNKIVKEIFISTQSSLNNIIFLKRFKKDNLIVATPHKLVNINNRGRKEFIEEISNVETDDKNIFLFSKDGRVLRLDEYLTVQDEKKFKFAHFSVSTIYKNKIYMLDKEGYLIVSNKNFTKHKVYKFPEVDNFSFVSGGKIYYSGNRIDLSRLSY
jgi:hypothetical protein